MKEKSVVKKIVEKVVKKAAPEKKEDEVVKSYFKGVEIIGVLKEDTHTARVALADGTTRDVEKKDVTKEDVKK